MTTAGSSAWRFAGASSLKAPVSWSAIRKSDALRTPRMMLFFIGMIVGRPAPAAIATWSNPASNAWSAVTAPPNRTRPSVEGERELGVVAQRPDPCSVGAGPVCGERLDLQAVHARDGAALVEEVVGERVSRRTEPDDEDLAAGVGERVW